jgi:hypothetical protein
MVYILQLVKYRQYMMIYFAGRACEDHWACEGKAFEEYYRISISETSAKILSMQDGLFYRQSLQRTYGLRRHSLRRVRRID